MNIPPFKKEKEKEKEKEIKKKLKKKKLDSVDPSNYQPS